MALYRRILSKERHRHDDDDGSANAVPYPVTLPPCCPISPPLPSLSPLPPLHADDQHDRRLANLLMIGAAVISAVLLLSITYCAVLRRRCRRFPLRVASTGPASIGDDDDDGFVGDGEPFHLVWYIRTVGLDESTIGSIAVEEYRASDGLFDGVSDCSVCLGEFHDGERVRLLPKCGHAFHVSCIDTWLRAHVNCPLCRAFIVDPNGESSPPAAAAALALSITATGGSVALDSASPATAETAPIRIQLLEEQQNGGGTDSTVAIGIPINPPEAFDLPPESSGSRGQSDVGGFALQPVRRSFSMDTPLMNSIIGRVKPEESIIDEEESSPKNRAKHWNSSEGAMDKGHSDIERSQSSSGRGFFFSKYGQIARIHSMSM
ncbi:hypothetical protein BHM03_00031600 [Ensete ventricosum]|nr:hypothetical protein BHM03_00031600 [Ensete ventricosum]